MKFTTVPVGDSQIHPKAKKFSLRSEKENTEILIMQEFYNERKKNRSIDNPRISYKERRKRTDKSMITREFHKEKKMIKLLLSNTLSLNINVVILKSFYIDHIATSEI